VSFSLLYSHFSKTINIIQNFFIFYFLYHINDFFITIQIKKIHYNTNFFYFFIRIIFTLYYLYYFLPIYKFFFHYFIYIDSLAKHNQTLAKKRKYSTTFKIVSTTVHPHPSPNPTAIINATNKNITPPIIKSKARKFLLINSEFFLSMLKIKVVEKYWGLN